MKKLIKKQIRTKVRSGDYTDAEWNQWDLWRYTDYKGLYIYIKTGKIITD